MPPMPRSMRNRRLPPGLRERAGYYSWTHPVTGQEFGLGRDAGQAIAEAVEANLHCAGMLHRTRLVDRLDGTNQRTLGNWITLYEARLAKRELAENTRRTYKSLLKRTLETFRADTALARITTLQIADALDALCADGKARTAQSLRSFLKDMFRAAAAAGWITTNPVLVTERIDVQVQRARLTLDIYRAVHAVAHDWLRNAMDLALVTAQRRDDIAGARFADFRDEAWFIQQSKTGNRLILPTALRLDAIGLSLADVVKRCRATGILSKHLIHQTTRMGNSPVGSPIWRDTISRRFTDALATLDMDFAGKTPPTFHEIRSLAERLYTEQGNVNTQELLGHKDPRTTQLYHDNRGAEWVRVKIA